MMRVLLLTLVIGLSSGTAMALNNNPWMRTCRIDQGIFWILKGAQQQEYVMCFFDNATIGAEEFFKFKSNYGESLAIQAYKYRGFSSGAANICENAGAKHVQGSGYNGKTFDICKFNDGSMIDATSLWAGPGSPETAKLDSALSSTY
ncbi:DUF333 domain-containing protein [Bdellovibrio svalbardensis]|uniref:DUF333 domain-containing protein n=1 Tax=Bdellovibrio svalbardensis TaxID=2972972 RepID=A0ABT6DI99_9BACT|nr:DUF333 domain-containing protein [Bdellovibrio svalbardensis]MDG0816566.1 DUF333 domain-containing protein [Bdellovibrio svalbardensis]